MSTSLREALEDAYEEHDTAATEEAPAEEEAPVEEAPEEEAPEEEASAEEAPTEEEEEAPAPAEEEPAPAEEAAESTLKAPVSWKADVREEWGKLPQSVQEEILRREQNIANVLQQTANDRKYAEEFRNMLSPYEPLIASQNSTPIQAVKNMMTTAAGLTLGTPQQKAQLVASVIKQYDVDIGALDEILAGTPQSEQSSQLDQLLNQKLAPIQNFITEVQNNQERYQQEVAQETNNEISQFAESHEFFEDVREEMADLIDLAAKRGQTLSLEEAYEKATILHPEIQKVLQGRKQQQAAAQRQQQLAQKQAAASSLPSGSEGSAPTAPTTLRGAIEEAWNNLS